MDTRTYIHILLLIIVLLGCAAMPVVDQSQAASAPGSVTLLDENGNRVLLETDLDNHALIQVFSEQGRGTTDVNITNETYPDSITLRLHLHGLEELTIRHSNTSHTISLSSITDGSGNNAIRQSTIDTTGERALAPVEPEWLAVELVETGAQAASAQPTIPLENGYIDVTLPPSFTVEQNREFTIQWVDFYR